MSIDYYTFQVSAVPPRNPFAVNPPAKSATVAGDSTSSSTIAQTLQTQTDKPAAMQQGKDGKKTFILKIFVGNAWRGIGINEK